MAAEEHPFVWEVPADGNGYVWTNGDPPAWNTWERPYRVLVRRDDATLDDYKPLDGPVALYKELARADLTEEGFLVFANRYGRLGFDEVTSVQASPGVCAQSGILVESFSNWRYAVAWLREAMRIWSLVEEGDHAGLAEVMRWEGGRVRYWRSAAVDHDLGGVSRERWEELVRSNPALAHSALERNEDPFAWALGGETLAANCRLGDLVRPAIAVVLSLINGQTARRCGPLFYWSAKRRRVEMQVSPDSLLGAIWWQFAQAVWTGRKTRACRECGRFFETAGGASRPDREVCSNACRSRAYRLRQERARAMHTVGRPFKEIAAELGSDAKTVKGWISGKKKEK